MPVRLATQPSTASSSSATVARPTSAGSVDRPAERVGDQGGDAGDQGGAQQGDQVGRASALGDRPGAAQRPAAPLIATRQPSPASRPVGPTVPASATSSAVPASAPGHATGSGRHRHRVREPCASRLRIESGVHQEHGPGNVAVHFGKEGHGWCGATLERSGSSSPAGAKSARCGCPSPARTRCWCAPAGRRSAAAPSRSCSPAGCRRASTRRCGRRSRRAISPAR